MSPEEPGKIFVDEDWKSQVAAEKAAAEKAAARQAGPGAAQGGQGPLPPASFAGLVSMLVTQALIALGQATYPGAQPEIRPDEARHFIDLLALLEEKTKGNLTQQESDLLAQVLHELRMGFVYATRPKDPSEAPPAAPGGSSIILP